ncbi:MAG: hypothetical protein LCH53_10785 [Bacteroidetes bacterium]|nr:hypothetical protein [Bacteroidota bacterium]
MKNFKPLPNISGPHGAGLWRGFTVTIEAGTTERCVRVDPEDPSKGMRNVDVGAYLATGVKDGKTVTGKPCEDRGDALQSAYKAIDEALGEGVRRRAIKDANGHTVGTHLVRAHEAQRV